MRWELDEAVKFRLVQACTPEIAPRDCPYKSSVSIIFRLHKRFIFNITTLIFILLGWAIIGGIILVHGVLYIACPKPLDKAMQ